MRTFFFFVVSLAAAQVAIPSVTWSSQQAELPAFEWFVFDHGEEHEAANAGLAVGGDFVFAFGRSANEAPTFENILTEDHVDAEGEKIFSSSGKPTKRES